MPHKVTTTGVYDADLLCKLLVAVKAPFIVTQLNSAPHDVELS